jgi:hypothetical protein
MMWALWLTILFWLYYYNNVMSVSNDIITEVKVEVKEEIVNPRAYYEAEPLRYIRFRGQELGYDDPTIGVFIEIARAESNFRPHAKNPRSTATGIYQFIHGTFHAYCKGMNVYDFVDNIDCFYIVLEKDGLTRGLNHWNASRSVWGKYER